MAAFIKNLVMDHFYHGEGRDLFSFKKSFLDIKLTSLTAMLLPSPAFMDLGNTLLTYGFSHNSF